MTTRDPYSGHQIKFERTDPTGRWSPIIERPKDDKIEGVKALAVGAMMGVAIAVMLFLAI